MGCGSGATLPKLAEGKHQVKVNVKGPNLGSRLEWPDPNRYNGMASRHSLFNSPYVAC